jgi:hypothetical protein
MRSCSCPPIGRRAAASPNPYGREDGPVARFYLSSCPKGLHNVLSRRIAALAPSPVYYSEGVRN